MATNRQLRMDACLAQVIAKIRRGENVGAHCNETYHRGVAWAGAAAQALMGLDADDFRDRLFMQNIRPQARTLMGSLASPVRSPNQTKSRVYVKVQFLCPKPSPFCQSNTCMFNLYRTSSSVEGCEWFVHGSSGMMTSRSRTRTYSMPKSGREVSQSSPLALAVSSLTGLMAAGISTTGGSCRTKPGRRRQKCTWNESF
jgi:hypothetical protein